MLGWFRSKPECPVDPPTREWIDDQWTWFEEEFGLERLRKIRVILPRAEFFPDPFQGVEEVENAKGREPIGSRPCRVPVARRSAYTTPAASGPN
ncbi:MAG: hypothetical protein IIA67_14075 [Planctomycetes bacterium]|nr:hypothetical protein [Planctomycetota bacterium]